MSRFYKFVDETCLGAYMSKADNKKKKKKKKKKMSEAKPELPPHLKKLFKELKAKEKELAKYGVIITDRTPKGYGPKG
jgi:hypothetical protein